MFLYIYLNVKKMLFYEDDTNFNENAVVDLNEVGDVAYDNMDLTVFHVIWSQLRGQIFLDDELYRYLDIHFIDRDIDWFKPFN